jgi:MFS family permease
MTGIPLSVAESGRTSISAAHRRMLVSCFLGTTIEWYDFLVYGFLGPLVFNTLFFPSLNPLAGTIAVFGVFAVGFAARPIGGVFFAHFGDRVGRKPIMVSTLILMGASTTLMGLVPTYAQIGIVAPLRVLCSVPSRCLPSARCRASNCSPGAGGCPSSPVRRSSRSVSTYG